MRVLVAVAALVAGCANEASGGGTGTETGTAACTDSVDNDDDGYIDCLDQDCWELVACASEEADDARDSDAAGDAVDPEPEVAVDPDAAEPGDSSSSPDVVGDSEGPPPIGSTCEPCGYGQLTGKVCAPNEQVFVNGATVTIETTDCDGNPVVLETTSDVNGVYHFDAVPCGNHQVEVVKGSFETTYGVSIHVDEHTDLSAAVAKICFSATSATIAVLDGNYDDIEGLLDKLGLDYDLYSENGVVGVGDTVELLSTPSSLSQYEIVFANCGGFHGWMPQDHPAAMAHIHDYVLDGGSFYMSDYAWVYGEFAFPEAIEFMGSDDVQDMFTDKSPQMIDGGQSFQATIADGAMAAYLGKTKLLVTFDQGPQIAPEKAGEGTFPHVSAQITQPFATDPLDDNIPLVLSYKPSPTAGRVIYTNFHNDAQTTADMLVLLNYLVFTL